MGEEKYKRAGSSECREFDANLTAFLEGKEIPSVRRHAEQCASCGSLLADIELIRSTAGDLPLESPSPRVWSNIRASLAEEGFFRSQESFWKRWMGRVPLVPSAASAAVLAFALVLAVVLVFRGDMYRKVSHGPSTVPSVAASVIPIGLSSVQANLVHTVEQMEVSYRARESSLDPSAREVYQQGLASLNNSIRECLDSLQKQPDNMLAREYLMQAYSQKAEILASALEYGGR